MSDTPRNISSELAQYAFKRAKEATDKSRNDKTFEKYPQYVKKMPAMIRNSGFAKAFAFGYSKDESKGDGKVYGQIYSDIRGWLKNENLNLIKSDTTIDMIDEIIRMDYSTYRRCENETMAFLDWLRRFAEGMSEEDDAPEEKGGQEAGQ